MPRSNELLFAFNRGEISALALARTDIDRTRLSAETMTNWLPKTLGPMRIRPGLQYLASTDSNNACRLLPFIASTTDTALIELTANKMRVFVSDAVVTRASVSTTISNGTFATSTSWTDSSADGGALTFGGSGLTLDPVATGGVAKVTRQITVAGGDQGTEHGLKIVIPTSGISRAPVYFRVGSTAGAEDYVAQTRLLGGNHHLTFTPTGDFHLTFEVVGGSYTAPGQVTSIAVEASGAMAVTTPWDATDIGNLQFEQSADVIYVACDGVEQYMIERRSSTSWSVVEYRSVEGPFIGKTNNVKLKVSQTYGTATMTADRDFFRSTHDNAIFRLYHDEQNLTMKVAGDQSYTDAIRVAGVVGTNYSERNFDITTTGTWSGTLSTRRSITSADEGFGDYPRDASAGTTVGITTNTTYNNEDEDDNLIAWYRVGFNDGDYTSGVATVALAYADGGDYGIVKIYSVASSTSASVEIIRPCRGTTYTGDWSEGAWSDYQGWPTAVALHEGRLWWFSGAQIWGSVSDSYEEFDQEVAGDSGPIIRTIGEGPVDAINWAVGRDRLLFGTAGGEWVARSSSIDTPITPTDFSIKAISSYGSKDNFPAVKLDDSVIFVHRSGKRLYQIAPSGNGAGYEVIDLTLLHPDILDQGVVDIAVQRNPDTRIHCVLGDGNVAILTFDRAENILAWSKVTTGTSGAPGSVERVAVLSSNGEDAVYYCVNRTINAATKRYIEKWALESESDGDTQSKIADSFLVYSGASTTSITGLTHLEGEAVVVWADGNVVEESDGNDGYQAKEYTVSSGAITLDTAAEDVVVGLAYTAQWKSAKLAFAAGGGSALTQKKKISQVGLLLGTVHHRGLQIGRDFTNLDNLPQVVDEAAVSSGTIHSEFDQAMIPFPGSWDTDSRLCIQGRAPYPATVLAAVVGMQTSG